LQPTPDYGTLGPGTDIAKAPVSAGSVGKRTGGNLRAYQLLAMMGGIVAALLVSSGGGPAAAWGKITGTFRPQKKSVARFAPSSDRDLDRQRPQKQAEILLARAVSRNDGATDQIQARLDAWHGKLHWDSQISDLTTVALNSSDQSVRASAIEVQLAAYGLNKSAATADSVARQADSRDHAQKIWALWALGLLGNRGIETERVVQVLTAHLTGASKDADEDSRRWAVEGVAVVGTTPTVPVLLEVMHNDASAIVRERAACSLAESGMLSHEQRLSAVPQLINYSDDPALDAQTRAWAFQALGDITKQRLPNDSGAWRRWYRTSMASGQ
jgi:HEAT repeat protein